MSSSKHVMLSYQWDNQKIVEIVFNKLNSLGINTWMDIKGGMDTNINDSMAFGVENAAVICSFMSPKYQESKNCKKELSYADDANVPIVPVMMQKDWKPTQWLGLITAGLLWIDFRKEDNIETRMESLAKEVVHRASSELIVKIQRPRTAGKAGDVVDLQKKPGRAFRHVQTNKFLAENDEVKYHAQSGSRTSLIMVDTPEATSYWVEEKQEKGSEIYFYKNFKTNAYMGYDPNGDYLYTKSQHFGAEEWILMQDDSSTNGERSVVIFANYGKKYLAIRNGKLTGVSNRGQDCVWILA